MKHDGVLSPKSEPLAARKASGAWKGSGWLTFLLAALVLFPVGLLWALRSPGRIRLPSKVPVYPKSDKTAFQRLPIGASATNRATRITNVQILDFDKDGLNDILVCDGARNSVILYRQTRPGVFEEKVLGTNLQVPAHASVVDINQDGKPDVAVAVLGRVFPSDELVGSVVVLENKGDWHFVPHLILEDVRRVADVQPGDFNGDGKMDLAVAVFGYARGEVLWLENKGNWHFQQHQLLSKPGIIHVPVGDLDGDGRPDIAAVVSQDEEEVWAFENLGKGQFKSHQLCFNHNFDVGSAGLVMADLNKDGRLDLLLPQGDNLEDPYTWPQPYHGCVWLENLGNWQFRPKQIANFGGTYAAAVGDIDGDGNLDVVLISMTNDWGDLSHPSVVWLENDGHQNFTPHTVDSFPAGLVTVACGDLNGDGKADIVAGGLSLPPNIEYRVQRVTAWLSQPSRK